ncbi:MAG: hypothetical protein AAGI46_01275 [Planctomycetota bacterium]
MPDVDDTPAPTPAPDSIDRIGRLFHTVFPILIAIGATASTAYWKLANALISPFNYDGDAVQHGFWAQRSWGATLLEHDVFAQFYASDAMAPPGYRWLMLLLGSLGDIQLMGELAMIGLIGITAVVLFLLGWRASGSLWGGAVLVAFLMWFAIQNERPFGSIILQRHFALVLLAAGLYGLVSRRVWIVGLAILGSSLFYPITLAVLGMTAFVHEGIRLAVDRKLPRGWWIALLLGLAAVGVLASRDIPDEYGPRVTAEQARTMPIFQDGGRSQYWVANERDFLYHHHRTGLGHDPAELCKAALVLLPFVLLAWRSSSPAAWIMLVVSVSLWGIAHLVPFHLYLPNRHVRVPLPLAYATLFASMAPAAVARLNDFARRRLPSNRGQLPWRIATAVVVPIALSFYAGEQFRPDVIERRKEVRRVLKRPPEPPRVVEEYLRNTAPDFLVAGHPEEIQHISLTTGRPTLVNRETLVPYYLGFYESVARPRAKDALDAYHAGDWPTFDSILSAHAVDAFYLVHHPPQPRRKPLEEPLATMTEAAIARLGELVPVTVDPPADRILAHDPHRHITLIRVGGATSAAVSSAPPAD